MTHQIFAKKSVKWDGLLGIFPDSCNKNGGEHPYDKRKETIYPK